MIKPPAGTTGRRRLARTPSSGCIRVITPGSSISALRSHPTIIGRRGPTIPTRARIIIPVFSRRTSSSRISTARRVRTVFTTGTTVPIPIFSGFTPFIRQFAARICVRAFATASTIYPAYANSSSCFTGGFLTLTGDTSGIALI